MGFAPEPTYGGIVVGLAAEARIARNLGAVRIGGTRARAGVAAVQLAAEGTKWLLSFGLAGGLDPRLRPGMLVIPRAALAEGERFAADPTLVDALGGATSDLILGASDVVSNAVAKRRLWLQTGAAALDLESGAVARTARGCGLPFAVLRAVCDPAERTLPPAALIALDQAGAIRLLQVLRSVGSDPRQIPALIRLARDAAIARRALIRRVAELGNRFAGM